MLRGPNKNEDLGKVGRRLWIKDMLDLELKPGDAMDHSRWKTKDQGVLVR